jgi:hypothetical protein
MTTLTAGQARATADAAFANTRAVLAGPPMSAGLEAHLAREQAAETEARAIADLQAVPGAAAQLDAELAAAETRPEVPADLAASAQAESAAELLAWFTGPGGAQAEAEAG